MRTFLFIFISLFVIADALLIADEPPLVIGIRGQEDFTQEFANKNGAAVLDSETVEFPNGNTFVRLKTSVTHRDTIVLIPRELDSDKLMELLIKIRTLKTEGARIVALKSPVLLKNVKITDQSNVVSGFLESLVVASGVQQIKESNKPVRSNLYSRTKIYSTDTEGTAVVSSQSSISLAHEVAKNTGFKYFGSNESVPKHSALYMISDTTPPVNSHFFELLNQIKRHNNLAHPVHLVTLYLPYARTDKKDQAGVTVTGRLVADLIEEAGAASITFVRAHAPQSQGFFSIPTFQLTSRPTITKYLKELGIDAVIAPDAGAQKETTLFADLIDKPVGVANKQRDPVSGRAKLIDVSGPNVKDLRVVIIDDETASGGTLGKVAEFLKEKGAKEVYAVVTHLAGNAKDALDNTALKQIIVTDTIPAASDNPKIKVLSMADELSEHIRNVENNRGRDFVEGCSRVLSILKRSL